jgi:hypothetical protein
MIVNDKMLSFVVIGYSGAAGGYLLETRQVFATEREALDWVTRNHVTRREWHVVAGDFIHLIGPKEE